MLREEQANTRKILVTQAVLPELSEYIEEISSLWDSHWITNMGSKHASFMDDISSIYSLN